MNLKGRWVRFKIRDIHLPSPEAVLKDLHEDDVITGRIVDVSDNGLEREAFAVVNVDNLSKPVVVPVARLLSGADSAGEGL